MLAHSRCRHRSDCWSFEGMLGGGGSGWAGDREGQRMEACERDGREGVTEVGHRGS